MTSTTDHLSQIRNIGGRDGIRAVLVYLNGLTEHRFTALYRFDQEQLKNVYFFDRERPAVETCVDIPIMASYCVFVRDSNNTFVTIDSMADAARGRSPQTTGGPFLLRRAARRRERAGLRHHLPF